MNKRKFLFVSLILFFSLAFTGCLGKESGNGVEQFSVTLVIDYGGIVESNGIPVVESIDVQINQGSSAFDLLDENTNLEYTEDSMYGAFVTSINGVGNIEGMYWMFYVNGEMASVGVSSYTLNDNDMVMMKLEEVSW